MELAQLLFSVLVSGAKLAAVGAVTEFAKGSGKAALEALKNRLSSQHSMKSLPMLEEAETNPAFEAAIKAELAKPEIAEDEELLQLAETLRKAISALPIDTQASYAVNIDEIKAGGVLLFEAVEGVRAKSATSKGDMTFKDIKAPSPGKN